MNKLVLTLFFSLSLLVFLACKKDKPVAKTVTDIDGNVYKIVKIGTQTWMAENLKTTKLNDGTLIPNITDDTEWINAQGAAYCWYNNDISHKNINGSLYNSMAVNTGKLAPKGWHVPSNVDWSYLVEYLIANGYNYDGTTNANKIGKAMASKSGWQLDNTLGKVGNDQISNNKTGFNGFPSGRRNELGVFELLGANASFYTKNNDNSNKSYGFSSYFEFVYDIPVANPNFGYSVRCIKD